MAITKFIGAIHKPKSGGVYTILGNTINYILLEKKTEGHVGSINCATDPGAALESMKSTMKFYNKEPKTSKDRLAYHWTISWSPEEKVSPELALKITRELCEKFFSDRECVYSVHTDKDHMHSHICFNSVSLYTGLKFQQKDGDWAKIYQPETDRLCEKYGLRTLKLDMEKNEEEIRQQRKNTYYKRKKAAASGRGKSNNKYYNEKKEDFGIDDYIRQDLDELIAASNTWEEFLSGLGKRGYSYQTNRKYFCVRNKSMGRSRRTYQLGDSYSEEAIRERILQKKLPEWQYSAFRTQEKLLNYGYVGNIKLSSDTRRYFAILYRSGKLKKGQNQSYYVIRQALRELKHIEAEQEFLRREGINRENADAFIKDYEKKLEELEAGRKDFNIRRAQYKKILSIYKKLKELEKYEASFQISGSFIEEHREYETDLKKLQRYGFTADTAEKLKTDIGEEGKEWNRMKRDYTRKLEVIKKYYKESEDKNKTKDAILQGTQKTEKKK